MPRDKRLQLAGGIYHVISRGIERRDIFLDGADRKEFLSRLERALDKTGCQCLAWCLMSNHFHLLIRTGKNSLSDVMRKLLTGYAIYFNWKHKRSGYLYQNRYKSVLCQEDVYLLELVRYIHLNPVRANLVSSLEDLDVYPWTGHSVIIGKRKNTWQTVDEILLLFGTKKRAAIEQYRAFVKDGIAIGRRDDLVGGGLLRSAGGWEGVKSLRKSKDRWQGDERILGDGSFVADVLKEADEAYERKERLKKEGWNIDRLAEKIRECYGLTLEELKRRGKGKRARARDVLCYVGSKELGLSGKDLSQYLGIGRAAVSLSITRAEKYDPKVLKIL